MTSDSIELNIWKDPKPWLVKSAVKWLEENIKPEDECLEFGGGASTIWWAERCNYTHTVEASPVWSSKLIEEMKKRPAALAKWTMLFSPCEWNTTYQKPKPFWKHPKRNITANQAEKLQQAYLNASLHFTPSIIIVDGSVRPQSLITADYLATKYSKIRMVIVDNTETETMKKNINNKFSGFKSLTFDETDKAYIPEHQRGEWQTTIFTRT